MTARDHDIVLFGATGFTGKLVAEYLARHAGAKTVRWAIAGRNRSKLEAVKRDLVAIDPALAELPVLVADGHDQATLDAIVPRTHVVCTTVGPFGVHGRKLAATCARSGTHYCDITGEVPFIRASIDENHDKAVETHARIVHCCGFDSIPSDLGVFILWDHARKQGGSLSWTKGFVGEMSGAASGGTAATMLALIEEATRDPKVRRLLGNPHALDPEVPRGRVRDPFEADVRGVAFDPDRVVVRVALRRRRLVCPSCAYSTRWIENTQAHESAWRHLDLGVWRLEVRATLRRLRCPTHGVHVEGVPFAREGSRFTADLEDLVTWLVTKTDRTAVCRLVRVDWQTIGRIIERVGQEKLDPGRLDGLYEIGIDEVSWRKQHRYLTLVVDHRRGQVVWGTDGAGAAAADRFFAELDPPQPGGELEPEPAAQLAIPGADGAKPTIGERAGRLEAISMDMGPGYALSAREHAPHAVICIDPFHVVALTTRALDEVRRGYWNELRSLDDKQAAKRFKDARWVLLKNPENLTEKQAQTHARLRDTGGDVWHAYTLKEALRSIFNSELEIEDVTVLIDEFITSASQMYDVLIGMIR